MSLINQMLKDLESRTQPQLNPEAALIGLHSSPSKKRNIKNWERPLLVLSLIVFFLLTVRTVIPWKYLHKRNATTHPFHYANVPKETYPFTTEHRVPTALTGLTFEIQKGVTSLRFLLSQVTLYRVNYDNKNDAIVIFLDRSHLIAALPNINYSNSAINKLELFNLPTGDLKIVIYLNKDMETKKIEFNESTKSPELQIDFAPGTSLKETPTVVSPVQDSAQYGSIKKLVLNMSVEGEYQKALSLWKSGDIESAVFSLRQLLNKYPTYNPARELLARVLIQEGEVVEAGLILKKGSQLQPQYIPFLEMRARLLADSGKPHAALDLLQSAPSPSLGSYPDYHAFVAALYQRIGESLMSAKIYEQLIRYDSSKAIWWVGLGVALDSLDKKTEALQAYTRANELQGLNPELSAFINSRINQYG